MSDYILAGPDIGVRFVDLDTLMVELGPDEGIDAAKASDKTPVVVASSDPLRLVRTARDGDTNRSFSDFLALVPPDAVPPSTRRQDEDDETDDVPVPATARGTGIFANRKRPTTVGEAVADMVQAHEEGSQSFFSVETSVTITVPWQMMVIATSQKEAEEKVNDFRVSGEHAEGLINFDPSRIIAEAVTRINHATNLHNAGWEIDPGEVVKLPRKEMESLARQIVLDMIDQLEAETTQTARAVKQMMQAARRR